MPPPLPLKRKRWGTALFLLTGAALCLLALTDPSANALSPRCPFRLLTGLSCPGCGFQRSLHALYQGHLAESLSYNYFLILSIPYAVAIVVAWVLRHTGHGGRVTDAIEHPLWARLFAALLCVWWVVRNIWGI